MRTEHLQPMQTTAGFLTEAGKDRIAIDVANDLVARGLLISGIYTQQRAKPVIYVAFDASLRDLVERDEACYYRSGADELGPYRMGQFNYGGAVVRWAERLTPGWRH